MATEKSPIARDMYEQLVYDGDVIMFVKEKVCGVIDCGNVLFASGQVVDVAGYFNQFGAFLKVVRSDDRCMVSDECLCNDCLACNPAKGKEFAGLRTIIDGIEERKKNESNG